MFVETTGGPPGCCATLRCSASRRPAGVGCGDESERARHAGPGRGRAGPARRSPSSSRAGRCARTRSRSRRCRCSPGSRSKHLKRLAARADELSFEPAGARSSRRACAGETLFVVLAGPRQGLARGRKVGRGPAGRLLRRALRARRRPADRRRSSAETPDAGAPPLPAHPAWSCCATSRSLDPQAAGRDRAPDARGRPQLSRRRD